MRSTAYWADNCLYIDGRVYTGGVTIDEAAVILAELSHDPMAPLVMAIYVDSLM